jgi:hypothetical protein
MTDKANPTSRAEQAAESAAKSAAQGETSSLQDFVAGLLPKVASKDSAPNASQESSNSERNRLDKHSPGEKGDIINEKKLQINDMQIVRPDEKGVIKLQTGDTLVRAGGMEVLVTKGGGSITVKPDGSYEVSGGTVKHDAKTGETTVDFGSGRTATIRDGKIDSVSDGKNTAWMVNKINRLDDNIRPLLYDPDSKPPFGITPKPYQMSEEEFRRLFEQKKEK